ncbi:MAG: SLOG family protein [Eubacteriales bacterium]
MRIAIIGSRNTHGYTLEQLSQHIPDGCSMVLSGGAEGIDTLAREYAQQNGLAYQEFLPDYAQYGKAAPLHRNQQLVEASDYVLAFWDRRSRGTQQAIAHCLKAGIPVRIIPLTE